MPRQVGHQPVLLVDDDETFRNVLQAELKRLGHDVVAVGSGREAVAALPSEGAAVALVDLKLHRESGIDVMLALHEEDPELPVIVLTGHGNIETAVDAMRQGAYDFLTKPCPLEQLQRSLDKAINLRAVTTENARLRRLLAGDGTLLGESPAMVSLRQQVARVGASSSAVLVRGESGTGKELVARAIHASSARATRPFVAVNCAGIPEALFESEMLGHERGAFTGADRRKIGLFEAADGGTIMLDEIGELPAACQAKLLRVLQSGEVRRVASATSFLVDVRVIAATNRDLVAAIRDGEFREDLYFRLAILEVEVPPLRRRTGDIPLLLSAFLSQHGRSNLDVDRAALELLTAHSWPGNVRELQNVSERLAFAATTDTITREDVEQCLVAGLPHPADPVLPLAEVERQHILAALRYHQGDKRTAARSLGISLRTLYNRLKEYAD